jgi:hypothetical protein
LPIGEDQTRTRDDSDEVPELSLDVCKIDEDVCMIELDIVDDGSPRPVMHEFGSLIEEGRVVLVSLDDEQLGRTSIGLKSKSRSERPQSGIPDPIRIDQE